MQSVEPAALKPLWFPMKRQWFLAFEAGTKRIEWRRDGGGYNAGTCIVGRRATIGNGYSGRRLQAVIRGFRRVRASRAPLAVRELYGTDGYVVAIRLDVIR